MRMRLTTTRCLTVVRGITLTRVRCGKAPYIGARSQRFRAVIAWKRRCSLVDRALAGRPRACWSAARLRRDSTSAPVGLE